MASTLDAVKCSCQTSELRKSRYAHIMTTSVAEHVFAKIERYSLILISLVLVAHGDGERSLSVLTTERYKSWCVLLCFFYRFNVWLRLIASLICVAYLHSSFTVRQANERSRSNFKKPEYMCLLNILFQQMRYFVTWKDKQKRVTNAAATVIFFGQYTVGIVLLCRCASPPPQIISKVDMLCSRSSLFLVYYTLTKSLFSNARKISENNKFTFRSLNLGRYR